MHIRRAIIEDIRQQLETITGLSGVWIQRVSPKRNTFPCLTLFAESEASEKLGISAPPLCYDRTLTVNILAWVAGTRDEELAEILMDEMALLIEKTVTLPANSLTFELVNTNFLIDEDDPEVNVVTLTYSITYTSIENLPEI